MDLFNLETNLFDMTPSDESFKVYYSKVKRCKECGRKLDFADEYSLLVGQCNECYQVRE